MSRDALEGASAPETATDKTSKLRKCPARPPQELDRQSSEDEAPPPRRRRRQASDYEEDEESGSLPRRKAARKAAAHLDDEEDESQLVAGEGGSSSSESEDGSEEEAPVVRRRPRAGCAKRARTASKADPAAAAKPYVPAAPTESRSRADMLSLLFACPALIGGWLDGLVGAGNRSALHSEARNPCTPHSCPSFSLTLATLSGPRHLQQVRCCSQTACAP